LVGTIGLFKYFQIGVTYIATPFISVILLGVFWRRTNNAGAVAGILGGVIIQLIIAAVVSYMDIRLHWLYAGGIAQVLTMLLIIVVSKYTPQLAESQVKPFIWRPSWVLVLDDGIERPWWKQVKVWVALYALAWFFIYWRFW
jgi:SSS family solute:Na+ symporter